MTALGRALTADEVEAIASQWHASWALEGLAERPGGS